MNSTYTTNHQVLTDAELPEGAEVVTESSSTPEVAARFGTARAAAYTARGYATECVGVVAHSARIICEGELITRHGYRAVLVTVS